MARERYSDYVRPKVTRVLVVRPGPVNIVSILASPTPIWLGVEKFAASSEAVGRVINPTTKIIVSQGKFPLSY